MNVKKPLSIMVAAAALLALSVPVVHASKETDSRIESSAQHSYVFKTYLKTDDIKIKSKDGAVVLTGTVTENFHKSLAQETVSGLPGVTSVDNRLETKSAPPAANSDAWLRDKIKITLSFHRSVSGLSTEVDVKDGIVTLRGTADSETQKELTTEYAKDVEGVKDVKNEMTVGKAAKTKRTVGEKIDDSSITAQVKMTLLYHRSTSAVYTTVKTNHGVVTLDGNAKSITEKDLATKLANDVNGVKKVINRMILE
jgi:osmotically-inducible protein OsmY